MTFNQYINNPYNISSISAQARESMRASFVDKLDKIYLRENGKEFKRVMYIGKTSWFLYIEVPSETIPNFSYDVVIQFIDPDSHTSLYDCDVRFFSNDPSFMFNAYVYDKNNLLISDLKPKLPREALKISSTRNPKNIPGYIKSIYFAYLMCKRYGFANKVFFESQAKKYHKAELLFLVEHASDKLRDRQNEEEKIKSLKNNKKEKTISRSEFENSNNKKVQDKVAKSINMTKRTKTVGHGVNKTSSNIKTTKRIGHGVNKRK